MIKRKIFLLVILGSLSISVNAGQYDNIQGQNREAQERRQEIQSLINEGRSLIQKIDKLVARRLQLDRRQIREVLSFIKSTNNQIVKERQYQQIAQQRCNQTGLQEHCSIVGGHVKNINTLKARLKILKGMKKNILRKKAPVPLPKK